MKEGNVLPKMDFTHNWQNLASDGLQLLMLWASSLSKHDLTTKLDVLGKLAKTNLEYAKQKIHNLHSLRIKKKTGTRQRRINKLHNNATESSGHKRHSYWTNYSFKTAVNVWSERLFDQREFNWICEGWTHEKEVLFVEMNRLACYIFETTVV